MTGRQFGNYSMSIQDTLIGFSYTASRNHQILIPQNNFSKNPLNYQIDSWRVVLFCFKFRSSGT